MRRHALGLVICCVGLAACIGPKRGSRSPAYVGNAALVAAGLASVALSSSIGTCESSEATFSPDNSCGLLQNEGHGLFLGTGILLVMAGAIGFVATASQAEAAAAAPPP